MISCTFPVFISSCTVALQVAYSPFAQKMRPSVKKTDGLVHMCLHFHQFNVLLYIVNKSAFRVFFGA